MANGFMEQLPQFQETLYNNTDAINSFCMQV